MKEPSDNSSFDKFILGTAQLGLDYGINNRHGKPSHKEAHAILEAAKKNGIKTLDTAQAYGDSINIIGEFQKTNAPFNIITKIICSEIPDKEKYILELLEKLNIRKFEAVLFHRFTDLLQDKKSLSVLSRLREKGLIENIGVSIYTNEELLLSSAFPDIGLIQLPFNLLDNYSLRFEGIRKAIQNKKKLHARSIFLQGLFFMSEESLPEFLQPLKPYLNRLHEIAEGQNMTLNELAVKYVLQIGEISGVLFGIDSIGQLEKNISYANSISLSQPVINDINSIHVDVPELLNPVNWK